MFLLGGMGAGDVKLAACFGAWLGPKASLFIALYSALAGGVMAVFVAVLVVAGRRESARALAGRDHPRRLRPGFAARGLLYRPRAPVRAAGVG